MRKNNIKAEPVSRFYRSNHCAFFTGIIASILTAGVGLIASLLIKGFTDTMSGVKDAMTWEELMAACGLFLIFIFVVFILRYISEPAFIRKALMQYKEFAFGKLTGKGIASFKDENTSSYLSALTNDCTSIENDYLSQVFAIVTKTVTFVGALVLMLVSSPLLTGVVILLMFFPVLVSALTGKKMQEAQKTVSDRNADLTSSLTDCLGGFQVIKSFKAEEEAQKMFSEQNRKLEDSKYTFRKLGIFVGSLGIVSGLVAQLGVFVVGAYLASTGKDLTAGTVIMFINLMNFLIQPISELPGLIAKKKAADVLIDKLSSMLTNGTGKEGGEEVTSFSKCISLENVSFSYDGEREVLHDITTDFVPGKSYAIVGGSGSGKSTLLSLLMASSDTYEGEIKIDDMEMRDISSESLYDLLTVIQQNVFVFNSSVRDNVTMFREFDDAKVADALHRAHLDELIRARGEDYLCGENGKGLSGGEKQRISIARSLLKDSSILLADEVTSALDAKTSHEVINEILELKDMTRIVVTHDLEEDVLRRYDEILVMKDGRIEEQGSFEDLMKGDGYFKALFTVGS